MLNLDQQLLSSVITSALAAASAHPRWVAAITRAGEELLSNPWIEAMDDHTLLIGSPSGRSYLGNGVCQCEAFLHGQPCWHRACARIWTRYLEAEDNTQHIAAQAKAAYQAANGPKRPLFANRDAETMRRAALGEERAVLEEMRRKRQLAAERATALMNEAFAP